MPQFHFQVFANGQRLAKEDRTLRLSFADACDYAVGEMPQQLKTQLQSGNTFVTTMVCDETGRTLCIVRGKILREDALDPAGNDRR